MNLKHAKSLVSSIKPTNLRVKLRALSLASLCFILTIFYVNAVGPSDTYDIVHPNLKVARNSLNSAYQAWSKLTVNKNKTVDDYFYETMTANPSNNPISNIANVAMADFHSSGLVPNPTVALMKVTFKRTLVDSTGAVTGHTTASYNCPIVTANATKEDVTAPGAAPITQRIPVGLYAYIDFRTDLENAGGLFKAAIGETVTINGVTNNNFSEDFRIYSIESFSGPTVISKDIGAKSLDDHENAHWLSRIALRAGVPFLFSGDVFPSVIGVKGKSSSGVDVIEGQSIYMDGQNQNEVFSYLMQARTSLDQVFEARDKPFGEIRSALINAVDSAVAVYNAVNINIAGLNSVIDTLDGNLSGIKWDVTNKDIGNKTIVSAYGYNSKGDIAWSYDLPDLPVTSTKGTIESALRERVVASIAANEATKIIVSNNFSKTGDNLNTYAKKLPQSVNKDLLNALGDSMSLGLPGMSADIKIYKSSDVQSMVVNDIINNLGSNFFRTTSSAVAITDKNGVSHPCGQLASGFIDCSSISSPMTSARYETLNASRTSRTNNDIKNYRANILAAGVVKSDQYPFGRKLACVPADSLACSGKRAQQFISGPFAFHNGYKNLNYQKNLNNLIVQLKNELQKKSESDPSLFYTFNNSGVDVVNYAMSNSSPSKNILIGSNGEAQEFNVGNCLNADCTNRLVTENTDNLIRRSNPAAFESDTPPFVGDNIYLIDRLLAADSFFDIFGDNFPFIDNSTSPSTKSTVATLYAKKASNFSRATDILNKIQTGQSSGDALSEELNRLSSDIADYEKLLTALKSAASAGNITDSSGNTVSASTATTLSDDNVFNHSIINLRDAAVNGANADKSATGYVITTSSTSSQINQNVSTLLDKADQSVNSFLQSQTQTDSLPNQSDSESNFSDKQTRILASIPSASSLPTAGDIMNATSQSAFNSMANKLKSYADSVNSAVNIASSNGIPTDVVNSPVTSTNSDVSSANAQVNSVLTYEKAGIQTSVTNSKPDKVLQSTSQPQVLKYVSYDGKSNRLTSYTPKTSSGGVTVSYSNGDTLYSLSVCGDNCNEHTEFFGKNSSGKPFSATVYWRTSTFVNHVRTDLGVTMGSFQISNSANSEAYNVVERDPYSLNIQQKTAIYTKGCYTNCSAIVASTVASLKASLQASVPSPIVTTSAMNNESIAAINQLYAAIFGVSESKNIGSIDLGPEDDFSTIAPDGDICKIQGTCNASMITVEIHDNYHPNDDYSFKFSFNPGGGTTFYGQ